MSSGLVLAVVGASGGVGASCLACALALAVGRAGRGAVVVDGRVFSGGLDVVVGADDEPGLRWGDLRAARGRVDGPGLLARLPAGSGVPVLAFGRRDPAFPPPAALSAVVEGLRGATDVVVLDAPRAGEDGCADLASLADVTVCLVGPALPALAAAGAAVPHLAASHRRLVLAGAQAADSFGPTPEIADLLRLDWVGEVPRDPRVDADLRDGRAVGARGALAHAASRMLPALAAAATAGRAAGLGSAA